MYFLINLSIACILLASCNSRNVDKAQIDLASSDVTDTINGEAVSDLKTIVKEYISNYNDTIKIDTSFLFEEKKVCITFKHYCLRDSALVIPSKYVSSYGTKEFVTHNFQSSLKITSDGVPVLDTIIRKSLFKKSLYEELRNYGVLLYPDHKFINNHISIDYSISIPLTDVGISAAIVCDYMGKLEVQPERR